ncbi:VCBS repeat-containing protein, partial [Candidatus Gracilibacteria bacterium]|nr:VCBS repeat-containing protein [Candidatus Gracilibacteria bacterium]
MANQPVTFQVSGAHSVTSLAITDNNGAAVLTYPGSAGGTDTITARATLAGTTVPAVPATATWAFAVPGQPVTPVLLCVTAHVDGTYTAGFGYQNPNTATATVPLGVLNTLTSSTAVSLPISFAPGTATLPVLTAPFSASETITWTLTGQSASASVSSPRCNAAPTVDAGADQLINLATPILALTGVVRDDGEPNATLTSTWSQLSGPASVTFTDPTVVTTTATFSALGTYVLRLYATDGVASAEDTRTIVVADSQVLPDLRVTLVQAGVTTDGQTLQTAGTISATIALSATALPISSNVQFFEDRDGDEQFDAAVDRDLGRTLLPALRAGEVTTTTVTIATDVLFTGNRMFAVVDPEQRIAEADETNNQAHTASQCLAVSLVGQFNPTLEWSWPGTIINNVVTNQVIMAPAVADLNDDGIADIVFSAFAGNSPEANGHLVALSGRDGQTLFVVSDPAYDLRGTGSLAVGDINNDGSPEILAVGEPVTSTQFSGTRDRLLAFTAAGVPLWAIHLNQNIERGGAAVAQFDTDPEAEIVVGAALIQHDGTISWQGSFGRGDNRDGPLSIVADLDMDGTPEIVTGNTAYRADGSVYWRNSGLSDGFPAVADFDGDSFPEIVVVSNGRVRLHEHTGTVSWTSAALPGGGAGGAPTIADMDADGQPEIGVAGAARYVVLEGNGTIRWTAVTDDSSSNTTGSSVFDFDGNGQAEIVYADEQQLRIYQVPSDPASTSLNVIWAIPSTSFTGYELPVIVDVDGDSNAEIVKVSNNYGRSGGTTGIAVYGDASDTWVATRPIWNQHSYHVTNINDTGTIPTAEEPSWTRFNNYRQNVLVSGCAT